jgi:hypothetical protein
MVKFTAKIWKFGAAYCITIPKQYVDNKLLTSGKKYVFDAEEVKNAETKN